MASLPRPTPAASQLQPHPVLGAHQADPPPGPPHGHPRPQPCEHVPSDMTSAFSALLSVSGLTTNALKKDNSQQTYTEKSLYVQEWPSRPH